MKFEGKIEKIQIFLGYFRNLILNKEIFLICLIFLTKED